MSNVVDVYVQRLRRKLEAVGQESLIRTRRGEGYQLTREPHEDALASRAAHALVHARAPRRPALFGVNVLVVQQRLGIRRVDREIDSMRVS